MSIRLHSINYWKFILNNKNLDQKVHLWFVFQQMIKVKYIIRQQIISLLLLQKALKSVSLKKTSRSSYEEYWIQKLSQKQPVTDNIITTWKVFFHWRAYLQRLLLDSPISSEHPKKKKEIKFINKKDLNHIFYKDK